jgi:DNA-binding GntR family transcriptional regulator
VTRYGPREITEVYDVRAELLGFAARLVAQTIAAERLEALERILDEMRAAVAHDDYAAYIDGHQRLRRSVWEATPNGLLRELIWLVWRRGLRLRAVALRLPGRMARSLHIHEQLVRALHERDAYYAERLMWLLSMDAKQALLDQYFGGNGPGNEGRKRIERELPDLSAFTLSRAPNEVRRQRGRGYAT